MKIIYNKFKYFLIILFSILTSFSLTVNIDSKYTISYNLFLIFILTVFFIYFYNKYYFKQKNFFKIVSIILSIFMVVGESFKVVGSFNLILKNGLFITLSILKLIGFYLLFYFLLNTLFNKLKKYKFKTNTGKIYEFIFEKHPFILPFIILLICYLPYIVAYYPGILSPDPSNQIKQFFHIETKYLDYSVLLDENVYITNHHPVLHTCLLGGLAKIGDILGNVNFGIFLYSIIQIVTVISTLSFTIKYMKKLNTPKIIRIITLLIYALVPVFPFYSLSVVKDVIFSCLVIIYSIKIFDIIKFDIIKKYEIILMIILMILIMMFRNNGIYVILLSMPFLIIFSKKIRKINLIILFVSLAVYLSYSKILLPTLKITPGSIREVLSIPFQQTARYVKYYEDELTLDERNKIDKILGIDDLGSRYNPIKADPVKNEFNKYATKEDLKNYFGVWLNGFFKRPVVYLEATINNTYGYFYPNDTSWYIYYNYDKRLKDSNIDYHYNGLSNFRKILSGYGTSFPYIPFIGMIVNIAFCNWIVLIICFFLMKLKKYKYLIWLFPTISLILVCFASPVNTYFRYALGIVFGIPIMISIFINILNEESGVDL